MGQVNLAIAAAISANTDRSRRSFDLAAYVQRSQSGPCFVCEIVAGNPESRHHVVYEDDDAIAFLNKYPVLYGYTLVAPRQHREHVTGDFTLDEYLRLQRVVYRVAEAVRRVVPTERIYTLSLGSQQGNRHVHWHIAPLPPGVPYEKQQLAAMGVDKGILDLSDAEMAALAARIREAMGCHAHDSPNHDYSDQTVRHGNG